VNFVEFRQKSIFSSGPPVFVILSVFREKRNSLELRYCTKCSDTFGWCGNFCDLNLCCKFFLPRVSQWRKFWKSVSIWQHHYEQEFSAVLSDSLCRYVFNLLQCLQLWSLWFRLTVTLTCLMDLRNYPLDLQTCNIDIGSCESVSFYSVFCQWCRLTSLVGRFCRILLMLKNITCCMMISDDTFTLSDKETLCTVWFDWFCDFFCLLAFIYF